MILRWCENFKYFEFEIIVIFKMYKSMEFVFFNVSGLIRVGFWYVVYV